MRILVLVKHICVSNVGQNKRIFRRFRDSDYLTRNNLQKVISKNKNVGSNKRIFRRFRDSDYLSRNNLQKKIIRQKT